MVNMFAGTRKACWTAANHLGVSSHHKKQQKQKKERMNENNMIHTPLAMMKICKRHNSFFFICVFLCLSQYILFILFGPYTNKLYWLMSVCVDLWWISASFLYFVILVRHKATFKTIIKTEKVKNKQTNKKHTQKTKIREKRIVTNDCGHLTSVASYHSNGCAS